MADNKITYESLFDILRRERNREELQKLEETFYEDVTAYLAEKQAALTSMAGKDAYGVSADAEKTRIQFHNIKRILKELYDRREKKIVMLALNAVRTGAPHIDKSSFLPLEQALYEDISSSCRQHRSGILDTVLRHAMAGMGAPPPQAPPVTPAPAPTQPPAPAAPTPQAPPAKDPEGVKVRFTKAVPRFSGGEDQVYGPYSPGDEASLPERIAGVLLKKGRAEPA